MGAAPPEGRCQKIRPDLSAFIDETLPRKRWEQVCYHLAGCQACRDEMDELSQVCSTLSRQREAGADAPADLAARLERIAGEGAAHPLYLNADGGPAASGLPSLRRARQKMIAQSGAALAMVAVLVMALAVAVAPAPVEVSAPVETARTQFNLSVAAIGATESVGAVLFAHERGAQFAVSEQEESVAIAEEQALRISPEAAARLIGRSLDPEVNYSGQQRVAVTHGEGLFLTAAVQISRVEGEGTSMVVFDAHNDRFFSTIYPELTSRVTEPPALWSFFQYPTLATLAGRSAIVIEARAEGRAAARWWVDVPSGVLMRSERFDADGRPVLMVGFESISFDEATLPDDAQQLIVLTPVAETEAALWCPAQAWCKPTLAGLPLVAFSREDAEEDSAAILLVYSDGFQSLTVSSSEGVLADDALRGPQRGSGQVSVYARQSGYSAIVVTTNGSAALLARAVEELPEEKPYPDSLTDQLRRGLERLFAFG